MGWGEALGKVAEAGAGVVGKGAEVVEKGIDFVGNVLGVGESDDDKDKTSSASQETSTSTTSTSTSTSSTTSTTATPASAAGQANIVVNFAQPNGAAYPYPQFVPAPTVPPGVAGHYYGNALAAPQPAAATGFETVSSNDGSNFYGNSGEDTPDSTERPVQENSATNGYADEPGSSGMSGSVDEQYTANEQSSGSKEQSSSHSSNHAEQSTVKGQSPKQEHHGSSGSSGNDEQHNAEEESSDSEGQRSSASSDGEDHSTGENSSESGEQEASSSSDGKSSSEEQTPDSEHRGSSGSSKHGDDSAPGSSSSSAHSETSKFQIPKNGSHWKPKSSEYALLKPRMATSMLMAIGSITTSATEPSQSLPFGTYATPMISARQYSQAGGSQASGSWISSATVTAAPTIGDAVEAMAAPVTYTTCQPGQACFGLNGTLATSYPVMLTSSTSTTSTHDALAARTTLATSADSPGYGHSLDDDTGGDPSFINTTSSPVPYGAPMMPTTTVRGVPVRAQSGTSALYPGESYGASPNADASAGLPGTATSGLGIMYQKAASGIYPLLNSSAYTRPSAGLYPAASGAVPIHTGASQYDQYAHRRRTVRGGDGDASSQVPGEMPVTTTREPRTPSITEIHTLQTVTVASSMLRREASDPISNPATAGTHTMLDPNATATESRANIAQHPTSIGVSSFTATSTAPSTIAPKVIKPRETIPDSHYHLKRTGPGATVKPNGEGVPTGSGSSGTRANKNQETAGSDSQRHGTALGTKISDFPDVILDPNEDKMWAELTVGVPPPGNSKGNGQMPLKGKPNLKATRPPSTGSAAGGTSQNARGPGAASACSRRKSKKLGFKVHVGTQATPPGRSTKTSLQANSGVGGSASQSSPGSGSASSTGTNNPKPHDGSSPAGSSDRTGRSKRLRRFFKRSAALNELGDPSTSSDIAIDDQNDGCGSGQAIQSSNVLVRRGNKQSKEERRRKKQAKKEKKRQQKEAERQGKQCAGQQHETSRQHEPLAEATTPHAGPAYGGGQAKPGSEVLPPESQHASSEGGNSGSESDEPYQLPKRPPTPPYPPPDREPEEYGLDHWNDLTPAEGRKLMVKEQLKAMYPDDSSDEVYPVRRPTSIASTQSGEDRLTGDPLDSKKPLSAKPDQMSQSVPSDASLHRSLPGDSSGSEQGQPRSPKKLSRLFRRVNPPDDRPPSYSQNTPGGNDAPANPPANPPAGGSAPTGPTAGPSGTQDQPPSDRPGSGSLPPYQGQYQPNQRGQKDIPDQAIAQPKPGQWFSNTDTYSESPSYATPDALSEASRALDSEQAFWQDHSRQYQNADRTRVRFGRPRSGSRSGSQSRAPSRSGSEEEFSGVYRSGSPGPVPGSMMHRTRPAHETTLDSDNRQTSRHSSLPGAAMRGSPVGMPEQLPSHSGSSPRRQRRPVTRPSTPSGIPDDFDEEHSSPSSTRPVTPDPNSPFRGATGHRINREVGSGFRGTTRGRGSRTFGAGKGSGASGGSTGGSAGGAGSGVTGGNAGGSSGSAGAGSNEV